MNSAELTLENHYRFTNEIVNSARELLQVSKETGSLNDWKQAIETCIKAQEFSGKEIVRYRVRKTLVEAASVLNGDYDGQKDVNLGGWSDGSSIEEVPEKAMALLELHRGSYG